MKKNWKVILGFVLGAIVVAFAAFNVKSAEVNFFFTSVQQPLFVVILCSALLGAIVVALFMSANIFSKKREIHRLQKDIKNIENDHKEKYDEHVEPMVTNYENVIKEKDRQIKALNEVISQLKSENGEN